MKAYIYFRSALDFGWNVIFDNKLLHGVEYLTSQGRKPQDAKMITFKQKGA